MIYIYNLISVYLYNIYTDIDTIYIYIVSISVYIYIYIYISRYLYIFISVYLYIIFYISIYICICIDRYSCLAISTYIQLSHTQPRFLSAVWRFRLVYLGSAGELWSKAGADLLEFWRGTYKRHVGCQC